MTDPLLTFDERAGVLHARLPRPDHASYSALDQWRDCPGRWAANRLFPPAKDWGSPLVLGTLCHAALETAMREPATDRPDWRALVLKGAALERERNRVRGWGDDPTPRVPMPDGRVATPDDWAAAAAGKLAGFRLSMALGRTPTPAAMEQRLKATVWGIPMVGAVDYRDRDGSVVDWKTGKPYDSHADQLRVYKRLLEADDVGESDGRGGWRKVAPVQVRDARDVYVERNETRGADLSVGAMASTGGVLRAAWDGMLVSTGDDGTGAYKLEPSFLCAWCPVAAACPVFTPTRDVQRRAMERSVRADDPRVGYVRETHTVGGKETMMDDELFAMLTDDKPAPEPSSVASTEPKPDAGSYPDPFATPEARAALGVWGMGSDADSGLDAKDKPTPEPEPTPASASKPEPTSAACSLKAVEGKPYEPTVDGTRLNVAGYGFGQLALMASTAVRLAGDKPEEAGDRLLDLIGVEWRVARDLFGPIAPDIPGLDERTPDRAALFAWLDCTLSRDVDRMIRERVDAGDTLTEAERHARAACTLLRERLAD